MHVMILYVYMSTTGLCKKTALAGFEDERRDGGFLQMDMGKKWIALWRRQKDHSTVGLISNN